MSLYDMMVVGSLKPCHHLNRNADRFFCRKSPLSLYIVFERNTFHKLHDHIEQSSVLSHVIYIPHIRMHQPGRRLSFAYELLDKYLVVAVITFQYLYRNIPVQLMVFSFIHVRHAAGTDTAQYLIPLS